MNLKFWTITFNSFSPYCQLHNSVTFENLSSCCTIFSSPVSDMTFLKQSRKRNACRVVLNCRGSALQLVFCLLQRLRTQALMWKYNSESAMEKSCPEALVRPGADPEPVIINLFLLSAWDLGLACPCSASMPILTAVGDSLSFAILSSSGKMFLEDDFKLIGFWITVGIQFPCILFWFF